MRKPSNPASCDETTTMSLKATGVVMCRLKRRLHRRPPEQLAALGIEPDEAVGGERHDLLHAGQRGDDRSRVAGDIVLRLPEDFAVGLVEADDAGPMPPADADDDPLAVDQRRAGVAVAAGALGSAFFTDEVGGEILDEVDAPQELAVGRVETLEFAAARLHENPRAVDDRRAAGTGAVVVGDHLVDRHVPQLLAPRQVVGAERLFFVAVIEAEDPPLGDCGRADAVAQLDLPEQFRPGGKRRGNAGAGRHPAGILRPSPARPIGGRGDGIEEEEDKANRGQEAREQHGGTDPRGSHRRWRRRAGIQCGMFLGSTTSWPLRMAMAWCVAGSMAQPINCTCPSQKAAFHPARARFRRSASGCGRIVVAGAIQGRQQVAVAPANQAHVVARHRA